MFKLRTQDSEIRAPHSRLRQFTTHELLNLIRRRTIGALHFNVADLEKSCGGGGAVATKDQNARNNCHAYFPEERQVASRRTQTIAPACIRITTAAARGPLLHRRCSLVGKTAPASDLLRNRMLSHA